MKTKAREWQLINLALIAAVLWERSVADAWPIGSKERQQSNESADEYESILRKRGIDVERIFRPANKKTISLYEIAKGIRP